MDNLDLTSIGTISAIVIALTQVFKTGINRTTVPERVKGMLTLLFVGIIGFAISYMTYWAGIIEGDTTKDLFERSINVIFVSLGGYAGIKQLWTLISGVTSNE